MLLVILGKGQNTDVMMYDIIIKRLDTQLQRESKLGDKAQLFLLRDITDHRIIKGTNYRYEVLVSW